MKKLIIDEIVQRGSYVAISSDRVPWFSYRLLKIYKFLFFNHDLLYNHIHFNMFIYFSTTKKISNAYEVSKTKAKEEQTQIYDNRFKHVLKI